MLALLVAAPLFAQSSDYIEVTATKIEEDPATVPSNITVITGDALRRSGARDLASALQLAGGVAVARGGDSGPAGVIPEIWGLREIDAFLLVVDGVPWGGAFNPSTQAIDFNDIERIEIVRGSAPVVYGATAFSGVIQIIHSRQGRRNFEVSGGSFGSAGAAINLGGLSASVDRERFRDDRTRFDRGRIGWHGDAQTTAGRWRFDTDVMRLLQDPASPVLREGSVLSPRIAIDTNFNPEGAHIDETRLFGAATYDTQLASLPWTTTVSLTHSRVSTLRGFIQDFDARDGTGFDQSRRVTDLYFDTHLVKQWTPAVRVVYGFDHLAGWAKAETENFDYSLDQLGVLTPADQDEDLGLDDTRNFSAIYAQGDWTPSALWRVDAGVRLNHARESRNEDRKTNTRGSAFAGISRMVGPVRLYADYRNTFKPAAIDFGPEPAEEILDPETSKSYEVGAKMRRGAWNSQASVFLMDLDNLLIATSENGLPGLRNGGKQRFKGFDLETQFDVTNKARVSASYGHHDAKFRDYVQDFDGVPTQLAGKRFEMSPRDVAALNGSYAMTNGVSAWASLHYTGSRYLNKRNTALASGFTEVGAGVGYRASFGEIRVDGRNLTNKRAPIAESELGDAQYYLLPARSVRVTYRRAF